jgi:OOP family OmpA-OmpF porin
MERTMKKLLYCISVCIFLVFATSCSSVRGGKKQVVSPAAASGGAPASETPPAPEEAPAPDAGPASETAQSPSQEAPLEPVPAAEPTPGHYKYCMTLNINFDVGKAHIRPESYDEVARVGEFMKKYPTTTAVIEGHTDKVGPHGLNMEISYHRADSVVSYLVEKFGIDPSRLSAKGYGFTRPVANNSTEAGRQKNRRIEAIIDCTFDVKEVQPPERLCMALQIEFDTDRADIRPEYHDEIAKVAEYLKKYPTATAIIEGHTDNVGGYDYNMKLSNRRAENVVLYLIGNFAIEPSRLSARGYGSTRRVAYNNTPEGRQRNRRINAIIDCVINNK